MLSDEAIEEVRPFTRVHRFPPGQALVRQGHPVTQFHVLVGGRARRYLEAPRPLELGELRRGAFTGEATAPGPASCTVQAAEPVTTLGFGIERLSEVLDSCPRLRHDVLRGLGDQLRDQHRRLLGAPSSSPPREGAGQAPRLGLALGGGGLRGAAHVGVLRVLLSEGLPVDLIAGTSCGAMVGFLHAAGVPLAQIELAARQLRFGHIFRWRFPRACLWDAGPAARTLQRLAGTGRQLQDLPVPLACVAADARTGEMVVLSQGDAISAVQASIAVPMLVQPVTRQGRVLVDGSVSHMVPTRVARDMGADLVVGVHVSASKFAHVGPANLWESLVHGLKMFSHRICEADLQHADVVVRPDFGRLAHHTRSIPAFIQAGEEAARQALPAIRAGLARLAAVSAAAPAG